LAYVFSLTRLTSLGACACLLYIVAFWRLGAVTFWDPDEAHYAETTREMIASGDWFAPYYNSVPFFDKPIYFHWLQAVPMMAAGPTEAAARLVPAIAQVALVATTGWLGVQLASPAVGLMAALLLACNPGVFGLARYAILDAPFTACLFGGVSLLAVAAVKGRRRLEWPGYLLIGCAVCLKGPLALALSGLTFGVAIAVSPEGRRRLLNLRWGRGLALAVAMAVPWYVYMWRRFDSAFVDGYFLNENLHLFARPLYANQPPWWFYLGILATGFLPWTGLLLGRAYDQLRDAITRKRRMDLFDVLLWSWTLAVVGFFSLSKFKLDHYVFPAAPALCLIAARAWSDVRGESTASNQGSRIGAWLIGPLLCVAGIVLGFLALQRLSLPASFLVVPGAVGVLGGAALVRYARPSRAGSGPPWLAVAALGVFYVGILVWVMPSLERGKVIPDIARWVAARTHSGERVATFRLNRWNTAFRFYVDRHVAMLESDEDARRFFTDPSDYYCVMTASHFEALKQAGVPMTAVYRREGLWATSGKALWRVGERPTEFVVAKRADRPLGP
jgi:4-amino-4-deoxy-L-arabinose transferase-like glycosyltransferase